MNINAASSFSSVMSFLKSKFLVVLSWLDGIHLSDSFSLLDLNIAILVFSILFTALFNVVRSGVNNSIGSVDRARRASSKRSSNAAHE